MGKADNYRTNLGAYLHKEIVLDCDCFTVINNKDDKRTYVLIQRPKVVSIEGLDEVPSLEIDHLWVRVPDKDKRKIYTNRYEATVIRVQGRVKGYVYRGTGRVQVGVTADKILIKESLANLRNSDFYAG